MEKSGEFCWCFVLILEFFVSPTVKSEFIRRTVVSVQAGFSESGFKHDGSCVFGSKSSSFDSERKRILFGVCSVLTSPIVRTNKRRSNAGFYGFIQIYVDKCDGNQTIKLDFILILLSFDFYSNASVSVSAFYPNFIVASFTLFSSFTKFYFFFLFCRVSYFVCSVLSFTYV